MSAQEKIANAMNTTVTAEASTVSRREFLGLTGSGLFVFFWAGPGEFFQETPRPPSRGGYPSDFNAYLRIAADGRVTCFVGKVELGQGAMTSLPMLLAEELDVALASVDIVMGDTDLCPWDMGTFGSLSTRQFGPVLRRAGAEARAALLEMAAERLKVPVEQLKVKEGVVSDASGSKRVSYGELVQGKHIERHMEKVGLKPASSYGILGKAEVTARRDGRDKVTGKAKYAGDFVLPGMLHARVLRPPAHGATLKRADTSAAEKMEGVRVIRDGDLIAVLHEQRDAADKAKALIKTEYDIPPATFDDKTVFEHLLKDAPKAEVVDESGDIAEGEKLSATIVEETYLNSYVAHATMETHTATATVENGKVTVWAATQTPFPTKQQVVQALQVAPEKVRIIVPYVGGGFGGKATNSSHVVEAARLAKLTGKPVQVMWDRSEVFFYDPFRPAAVVKIRAGLDSGGKITFWDFRVVGAGDGEAKVFYDIPHKHITSAGGWFGGNPPGLHPFAVGPWRAPSANTNTFARESHVDILARKAGVDPVEFRLKHISDRRMCHVVQTAARQFGWKPAAKKRGHGFGVSCGIYSGTYVAMMAEVEVEERTGAVQVKRVVSVQDQGATVNLDGTRQQMEGAIMMGLGYALTEEVHFRGGEILERNFDSYELPRFSWMPKIETVVVENPNQPVSGCGEPPIINVGAVIANAIYDAVGARVVQLPMTAERVKAGVKRD
ncbi:MAG TPA: molybdopterin cofactor-binding domain-containing protein [Candidatus Limnocylindrales bacterium]|nr:molybdopterin cofactor-binding domain-containing protein [Candidatus Limnocylindrales bacterium]